jgi:hypothetical protein
MKSITGELMNLCAFLLILFTYIITFPHLLFTTQ